MTPDLTYAIGDIHGCHGLLLTLLEGVVEHAGARSYRLVFLGDYIDRGPDSAEVIQTVRQLQQQSPEAVICLKGSSGPCLGVKMDQRSGSGPMPMT